MDDSTFDQLEAALSAAPGNVALLTLLLGASLERGEHERGLKLLPADLEQWPDACALKLAAAQLCLAAGQAPRALQLIEGDDPAARLLKARVLAALERLKEAQVEYRAAVDANPALEDMALWRRLNVSVLDFPAAEGRPRLRVISNDDTDQSEVVRLLVPERKP